MFKGQSTTLLYKGGDTSMELITATEKLLQHMYNCVHLFPIHIQDNSEYHSYSFERFPTGTPGEF